MSADVSARSVSHAEGVDKVRALQRVLYRSAKQNPTRRFHALYDKVARSDILWRAWVDVATNAGAPGVDGVSIDAIAAEGVAGVRAFLDVLAAELRAKTYRPQPLWRVHIPKPGKPGETRPLGIPTVRDRVVMAAAKLVLEPVFEADFAPCSFGFRPKRSAHDAIEAIRVEANRGRDWVLDADIKACFDAPLHCPFCCWCVVEEAGIGRIHLDSQAFSASGADVDGFELAALDTLQHGLAGHAQSMGGLEHRQPAGWGFVDEAVAQLVGHADAPGGAGGELFAGDEPIVEPAVHGGSSDAEDLGRVGDGDELAVGLLGRSLV